MTFLWRRERAEATVLAIRSGMRAGEDFFTYQFALEVRPPREPAFKAEAKYPFMKLQPKPAEGETVRVRYGGSRRKVSLDLSGDPRFDDRAARREEQEHYDEALGR